MACEVWNADLSPKEMTTLVECLRDDGLVVVAAGVDVVGPLFDQWQQRSVAQVVVIGNQGAMYGDSSTHAHNGSVG